MERINNFKPFFKPFAWGVASGAVGWWIVLAFVFGWTSFGTAERQAAQEAQEAVVAALAPVCADRFLALPKAAEKKATLAKATSWERRDLFPEELVTLPDGYSPDPMLVNACTKIVLETPLPDASPNKNAASTPGSSG